MLLEKGLSLLGGKVALVTGAASGIGRATAITLAREGARVGLLDIARDALDTTAAEINTAAQASLPLSLRERGSGGEGIALPLSADVRDPAALADAVAQLTEHYGQLDILFANAGIPGVWAPVEDITPDEFDQLIGVNLKGTFLSVQAALPALRQQGGAIVITSSVTGTRMFSSPGATVYASSKAAQLALGKMLAMELARDRIRVNVICPGTVTTDILNHITFRNLDDHHGDILVPLTDGVFATPEQIASVVLFLVSDLASHVTGEVVVIDGAESLIRG